MYVYKYVCIFFLFGILFASSYCFTQSRVATFGMLSLGDTDDIIIIIIIRLEKRSALP